MLVRLCFSLLVFGTLLFLPVLYGQSASFPESLKDLADKMEAAVGDSAASHQVIEEIKLESERLGTDQAYAFYLEKLDKLMYKREPNEARVADLQKALAAYERAGDFSGQARLYGRLGFYAFVKQDYLGVYQNAEEQLIAGRKAGDDTQIGSALGNLGLSSKLIGNKAQARLYYQQAAVHARALADTANMAKHYHNMANLHTGKDPAQVDSALMFGRIATKLLLASDSKDYNIIARRFEADGKAYMRRGDVDSAMLNIVQALTNYERSRDKRNVYRNTFYLGRLYRKKGDLTQAGDLLYTALGQLSSLKNTDPMWLYAELGDYHKDLGDADSTAYYYGRHASAIRKSNEKKQAAKIASLETSFRTKEQKAEIGRMAKEEELNQRQIKSQRGVIIGGALILALLGILAYRLFRQRAQIAAQNEIITKSLGEKEMLMKEIHHRVKNNLQMVSSLLSLQSRYIDDEGAVAALKMGNSRVRSMALIHQRLYLENEVSTKVNAKDYLEKLASELLGNLVGRDKNISLHTDLVDRELDIDTMIPLGLIANELITNALKYAYEGRDQGHLRLGLNTKGGRLELMVEDDGKGMEANPAETPSSFGYLLINSLVEQLEGKLSFDDGAGTTARVNVPLNG